MKALKIDVYPTVFDVPSPYGTLQTGPPGIPVGNSLEFTGI